jgi:hypothetical protein
MSVINSYFNFEVNCLVINCDVKSIERFNAVIRTKFNADTEISEQVKHWIVMFSEASCTNWIVERKRMQIQNDFYTKKSILANIAKKIKINPHLNVVFANEICTVQQTLQF